MSPSSAEPSSIVVRRIDEWENALRRYTVKVDGRERGKVGPGESLRLGVEPGQYVVRTGIGFCWSPPLEISLEPGEHVELETGSTLSTARIAVSASLFGFVPNLLTILRSGWFYLRIDGT